MELKQFDKIEQWFLKLNVDINEIKSTLATKQLVEGKFQLLFVSMQNLFDRFVRLEERFGKQNEEIVVMRLAIKKLEEEIEELRSHIH